ncbi:MAG: hypothetical protein IID16_10505 [Candidatus Marinimicrobia bacterium]|nr:hypothetical protein [Candidatus Neomarinimicrobiota bacterium]
MTRKGHGIPACCGQAPNRVKEAFCLPATHEVGQAGNRNGKMEENEEIVE